jgi:5-formyltetrahydrofolate cyclo-ligase
MSRMDGPGKADVRRAALRRRRERPAAQGAAAGEALVPRVLAVLEEALGGPEASRTVAAYASIAGEPPTGPLLAALARRARVLLPVLLDDGDLDWALAGGGPLVPGRAGTSAPRGARQGRDAVASAAAVVVPGVAGDPRGGRLGRGGGSYDRALARVPAGVPVVLLLFDDEVVDAVPTESHDRRVTHVVTPSKGLVVAQRMPAGLD